tara:strand:+ start:354 stop:1394 length:1041 start_codon:yes stop_codon:yes gene_type:complete
MKADFVKSRAIDGLQALQVFNQNTLHFCHNALRRLPSEASAFSHVHHGFSASRVDEIETFLVDQTEKLIELTKKNCISPDFGIDITPLELRNITEKRFVALLGHFINYSEKNNPKVYESLRVEYADGAISKWDKKKLDSVGGSLKGNNPIKLYNFVKAVANSADPKGELNFEPPMLKGFDDGPAIDKLDKETLKISMPLVGNGSIEIDEDMTQEDFLALLSEVYAYSEALKHKENSLKLRQETLMSTFKGNPNGTVRDMLLGTNAMTMELKREQMILKDVVSDLSEFAEVHNFKVADSVFDKIENVIDSYNLLKDNNLNFIIKAETLDNIQHPDKHASLSMNVGAK